MMENRININGTWYVREGLETITESQVIDYLEDLVDYKFVNIVEKAVEQVLRNGYFDNSDIINGDVSLAKRQVLAIFLAVNK
jgi:hypothetical protein